MKRNYFSLHDGEITWLYTLKRNILDSITISIMWIVYGQIDTAKRHICFFLVTSNTTNSGKWILHTPNRLWLNNFNE